MGEHMLGEEKARITVPRAARLPVGRADCGLASSWLVDTAMAGAGARAIARGASGEMNLITECAACLSARTPRRPTPREGVVASTDCVRRLLLVMLPLDHSRLDGCGPDGVRGEVGDVFAEIVCSMVTVITKETVRFSAV